MSVGKKKSLRYARPQTTVEEGRRPELEVSVAREKVGKSAKDIRRFQQRGKRRHGLQLVIWEPCGQLLIRHRLAKVSEGSRLCTGRSGMHVLVRSECKLLLALITRNRCSLARRTLSSSSQHGKCSLGCLAVAPACEPRSRD